MSFKPFKQIRNNSSLIIKGLRQDVLDQDSEQYRNNSSLIIKGLRRTPSLSATVDNM